MRPLHEIFGKHKKRDFINKCMTDFGFFCKNVLSLEIAPFHIKWAQMFYSQKRSCIMSFRGSGKTTILGQAFPIWCMLFDNIDRKRRRDHAPMEMLIISATLKDSMEILRGIKDAISDSELLYQVLYPDAGGGGGGMWTKTDIQTKNGCIIRCKPYTDKGIRGRHVNYLLMDEASLYRDLTVFTRACLPTITVKDGNVMLIGTPMTENDLLARCMHPTSGYSTYKLPSIQEGSPSWPERFTMDMLSRKRNELGEIGFAREYMCEVISDDARAIDTKMVVRAMDETLRLVTELDSILPASGDEVATRITGIDLAMSAKGDYSVSITLEAMPDGKWRIIHMDRQRGMGFQEHADWIERIYKGLQPQKVIIDRSQFGDSLIEILRMEKNIPCDPFRFTPDSRKDIISRVIQMFDSGRLKIPRYQDDDYTMTMTDNLINEVSALYPTKTSGGMETYAVTTRHDDCLMALAMACSQTTGTAQNDFHYVAW